MSNPELINTIPPIGYLYVTFGVIFAVITGIILARLFPLYGGKK